MAENKIKFGIENCVYAARTVATNGTVSYGAVKSLPGAVSLSLSPEGTDNPFYADDIEYYRTMANNGYSGTLELAIIPDEFRIYALGEVEDSNHVLVEKSNASAGEFAFGFKHQGDDHDTLFWFYNCVCTRPDITANTKEDSISPQTETLNIVFRPETNKVVRVKTIATTNSSTITGWFSSVYNPALV